MQAKLTESGFNPDPMLCLCTGQGSVETTGTWDLTPCPFHADPEELAKWRLEQAAPDMFIILSALQTSIVWNRLTNAYRAAIDAAIAKAEGRS